MPVLPAIYAGCAVLKGHEVLSHRTGREAWREVREHVWEGCIVLHRYGGYRYGGYPVGVCVADTYINFDYRNINR
jgi:hypothetical protein